MKFKVIIDRIRCKGCELCATFCPKGLIRMTDKLNPAGFRYAEMTDPSGCTGCSQCAQMCADSAIEIEKLDPKGNSTPAPKHANRSCNELAGAGRGT